jgi:tetratricopeptide (TPR) repeat protein
VAKTVEELMEEGLRALEQSDLRKAARIGRKLIGKRHSAGFELSAKAEWELENREKAVKVLEEGVEAAPGVGSLWELLGCFLSDLERYEASHAAFERALETSPEPAGVHYNIALLLGREGKWGEALEVLETAGPGGDPALSIEWELARITALNHLERHEEAGAEATAVLESLGDEDDGGSRDEQRAGFLAERAVARWFADRDRDGATADALEALRLHRGCDKALWALREIEGVPSPAARYFRILATGRWHEPIEEGKAAPSFYTTYEVVADSPEEALDLARRLEPPEVRARIEIEEVEDLEARPEDPKGVYRLTGRAFWSPEK